MQECYFCVHTQFDNLVLHAILENVVVVAVEKRLVVNYFDVLTELEDLLWPRANMCYLMQAILVNFHKVFLKFIQEESRSK